MGSLGALHLALQVEGLLNTHNTLEIPTLASCKLGVVRPAQNPSVQEVEAGRSKVQGHPQLRRFENSLRYLSPCLKKEKKNC